MPYNIYFCFQDTKKESDYIEYSVKPYYKSGGIFIAITVDRVLGQPPPQKKIQNLGRLTWNIANYRDYQNAGIVKFVALIC